MTPQPTYPDRLAEVERLSLILSQRVLAALVMKHVIPAEDAIALAQAARLLQDYDVEWPSLLAQVIYELAEDAGEPHPLNSGIASVRLLEQKE